MSREMSRIWSWLLILGIAWIWYGMFVLSYRVGSLVAVAALVGVAFLFGGTGQLLVAGRVETWRWLFIVTGILAVAAEMTFAWPDITLYVVSILMAWYLIVFGIVHLVSALAGAQGAMVVDPADAGDRRALPGGVGHPLLGSGRC